MRRATAIVSGGLDSVVLAYLLRSEGYFVDVVSFDYGQDQRRRELEYAEQTAAEMGSEWRRIELATLGLQNVPWRPPVDRMPIGSRASLSLPLESRSTIPNRNATLLVMAYAIAATTGAEVVGIGVSGTDRPTPDCRPEFLAVFETMEHLALDGVAEVRLVAPFVNKSKADVVRIGTELGAPLAKTWSCYRDGAAHCGACLACLERTEAFRLAGIPDPTEYVGSVVSVS